MKRLDEMDFNEISIEYNEIFNFINADIMLSIKNEIENTYDEYLKYCKNNFKVKGGTLGRGEIKWGRNIIWGWYIEKIMYEIFKQNQNIKNIEFYGGDSAHKFNYDINNKKIIIEGAKETKPDFLLTLDNNIQFCIELKTAAKEVFTIKKGNVEQLYLEAGYNNRITLILMIDLENKLFSIQNLEYFHYLKPFINQRMEGQLCYNFPIPEENLELLTQLNFKKYLDNKLFDIIEVKKIKALKIAEENNNKYLIDLIKNKIKLDKIKEEKNYNIELYDEKISKILLKNKELDKMTWNDIFNMLNII